MSDDRLDKIQMLELQAIEAFRSGNATVNDWRSMADMMNLSETMANDGIGPEVLPICASVQLLLIDAKERFDKTGKMGTTGPGLHAFRCLQEYHHLQRTSVDLSTYERSIRKCINRIRSSHPDTVVLT